MKEFINTLMSENKSLDNYPWWVYAIVMPVAFILLAIVAS
jgi:hypothetical protein